MPATDLLGIMNEAISVEPVLLGQPLGLSPDDQIHATGVVHAQQPAAACSAALERAAGDLAAVAAQAREALIGARALGSRNRMVLSLWTAAGVRAGRPPDGDGGGRAGWAVSHQSVLK